MSGTLRRLCALSALQWRWLIAAQLLMPLIVLSLRTRGYSKTLAIITPERHQKLAEDSTGADIEEAQDMAWIVNIAATRGPFKARCLTRSLALLALLHRTGIPAHLQLGLRKNGDDFGAHAWVELQGIPLNDSARKVALYQHFRGECESVL